MDVDADDYSCLLQSLRRRRALTSDELRVIAEHDMDDHQGMHCVEEDALDAELLRAQVQTEELEEDDEMDYPATEDNQDRLKKLRYLMDHLKQKCQELFQPNQNLAIDERMVKSKDPATEDNQDRLKKLRYLMDHLKQKCQELFQPNQNLAIDERMVKSKGRSG
ncbi:hypothetical protein SKAU_G00278890 [Synaphobranchus kaupii]|uniref:PiggyBac transposable element-derived protein domain-containing protein n=1 Tax=Synaphobranchus kaupii TaxID=118154 RepID=A0A9Q1EWL4_SYNKA|nr:hypothetical protein SKAU_G00278890 [Synaphobranchus kaupii]